MHLPLPKAKKSNCQGAIHLPLHLLDSTKGVLILKRQNMAAIYLRLSRDDGGDSESNSIQTQRLMLQKFANDNRIAILDEYIDDGVSGTTFERPNFKRMIKDIEDKKISTVIVKEFKPF